MLQRLPSGATDTMSASRLPQLDGVRAISILLVLGAHMLPLGPKFLRLNEMAGIAGMSLFFCLSGFLITRSLNDDPSLRNFMIRRLTRILPPLIIYAAVIALLMAGRWDSFFAIIFGYLNYADQMQIPGSGHLWSICVELQFYLAIGLIVALLGRRGLWVLPIAAVIVTLLRVQAGAEVNIRTHLRVDEILSGGLLALIWIHRDARWARPFVQIMTYGAPLLLVLWLASANPMGGPIMYLRPYLAALTVGTTLFAVPGVVRQFLSIQPLAYVARISYALYIWHPLTMLGWLGEGSRWTLYLIKRPISFALTFLLADLSTRTVEAWAMRKGKSWLRRTG